MEGGDLEVLCRFEGCYADCDEQEICDFVDECKEENGIEDE
jgi:alpha-galactosidase